LLQTLLKEFSEKLMVFPDRAPYSYAKDLREFVRGERSVEYIEDTSIACVRGETLQVWYFPSRLPELNPLEQCWNQFKSWYRTDSSRTYQRWNGHRRRHLPRSKNRIPSTISAKRKR
jgi:hypothetical protein